ncbi:MAG TPA: hypothetical protein VKT81_25535 [Bryobacteraceae bacterium]|nr:hypothetical protein [Bryobacteraceae bacterium]
MTDEIRKLLGGYATNTLTERERQVLFEAALDDQELFDALQQEQALRDLLDDPVSRVQIRQALDQPKSAPWWLRWWTWTAAGSAVAASVLTMAIIRTQLAPPQQRAAAVASSQPATAAPLQKQESDADTRPSEPAPIASRPAHSAARQVIRASPALADNERKDFNAPTAAPAAPPPPAEVAAPSQQQIQLDASGRNTETQAQNQGVVGGAISGARQQQDLQANASQLRSFSSKALSVAVTPVPYTLLKRDAAGADQTLAAGAGLNPGDAVRIRVSPTRSGYLFLSREDAPGQFTRVYPETGAGLPVAANGTYVIPASAIDVTASPQRFRVTVIPASAMEVGAAGNLKAKSGLVKKEANPNPPLFVDVVIGPAVR